METRIITITVPVVTSMPAIGEASAVVRRSVDSTRRKVDMALIRASYLVVAATTGILVGSWAVPYAIAERGYTGALGGEWMLIAASICVSCWLHTRILRWGWRRRR